MEEPAKLLPHIPDDWVPFTSVDWKDEKITQYHIDTRDFNVLLLMEPHKLVIHDNKVPQNPERYYYTSDEIKELITRLYQESGENRKWRMLTLKAPNNNIAFADWSLKYIRIYRTDKGLILTNNNEGFPTKNIMNYPVNKEY